MGIEEFMVSVGFAVKALGVLDTAFGNVPLVLPTIYPHIFPGF
jgi:hypothetical protein